MKFSIEKKDLQNSIQYLFSIIPSKNAMPVLTNYLIEADEQANTITFTATDLEITVISTFDASVIESGKIAVSARNLTEIINSLPDALINFMVDDDELVIKCKQSNFKLLCAEVSQFPLIPQVDESNAISINAQMFKKMIDNTTFAVSTERNRPIFTGIYWKMSTKEQAMVATDGKKIAEFKLFNSFDIEKPIEQVIPTKGLIFLDKVIDDIDEVSVLIESNRVMFKYGQYTVFTHILEGQFPDYTKAMPTDNNSILKVDKILLRDAVKRVSLLASEDTNKIKFDIRKESISIESTKQEEGEANEKIDEFDFNGEELSIAFNYKFLISILNVIETKKVEMHLGHSTQPVLFYNTEQHKEYSARFLLMPLRLQ